MVAFNREIKNGIVKDKNGNNKPCAMCGKTYPLPEATHIIDKKEWKDKKGKDSKINSIPLCPNCHKIFDEVLKPCLYSALKEYGVKELPVGWSKNNKILVSNNIK